MKKEKIAVVQKNGCTIMTLSIIQTALNSLLNCSRTMESAINSKIIV